MEQSVQTLINYTCLAQRAADLAYVRHLILSARFRHYSVGYTGMKIGQIKRVLFMMPDFDTVACLMNDALFSYSPNLTNKHLSNNSNITIKPGHSYFALSAD